MKILFTGKYDPLYNRTRILIEGLQSFPEVSVSFYDYPGRLKVNPLKLARACREADVLFLPSFTHLDVPFIKAISRKPVIFDPLISRYLTKVFDYKKVWKYSPRALKNFLKDKISMSLADRVLCDTEAHKHYFQSVIGIPADKLKVLPVGVNTEAFHPGPATEPAAKGKFIIGFYGSFIPLQGTGIIVETARLLQEYKDLHFQLIGDGFEFSKVKNRALNKYKLDNISFTGWADYHALSEKIRAFDIALGIFGETLKADLVIPNKIYHYASMQKAIVTKDTPAIREIFEDDVDILLSANDPGDIARKILLLKANPALRERIARNGYNKITKTYNHREIARRLISIAEDLLGTGHP